MQLLAISSNNIHFAPLRVVAQNGHINAVECLINQCIIDNHEGNGFGCNTFDDTLLLLSAIEVHLCVVEYLKNHINVLKRFFI